MNCSCKAAKSTRYCQSFLNNRRFNGSNLAITNYVDFLQSNAQILL
jgi:hypothetical protein